MGSKPKVVQQDPEGDAQRAKDKATADANAEAALKRTSRGSTALSSASQVNNAATAMAQGLKKTLGG